MELRARLAQQAEAIEQLRGEIGWLTNELIARDAAADTDGGDTYDMAGAPPEWRPMLRAIRQLVHHRVPQGSRLVVVSSGVDVLLRHAGYRAEHLSQDSLGGYAGSHPGCGRAAIVQLEAARWRGADALLMPSSELWWLEHYPELAKHLDQRYPRLAEDDAAGVIWGLREPGRLREVHDLLAGLCGRLDHRPALLDWHTGHDLASYFDEYKVFSPLGDVSVLPYLDGTIDVVAVGDATTQRRSEARRVASSFVVRVAQEPGGAIDIVWRANDADDRVRDVSIIVASRGGPAPPSFVEPLLETLPAAFDGEIVVDRACDADSARANRVKVVDCPEGEPFAARLRRCAAAAAGDVIVLLDGATWPTPGWLRPLVALLRGVDDVGFVTGMVVEPDGRLVAADPDARALALREERLDAARHSFVRRLDPTPARFFATQRDLFLEWTDRPDGGEDVAVAFGGFVRSLGKALLYEPEAVAISSWSDAVAPAHAEARVA